MLNLLDILRLLSQPVQAEQDMASTAAFLEHVRKNMGEIRQPTPTPQPTPAPPQIAPMGLTQLLEQLFLNRMGK